MRFNKTNIWTLFLLLLASACVREKIVLEDFGDDHALSVLAVLDGNGGLQQIKLGSAQKVIGGNSGGSTPIIDATVYVVHETDTTFFVYEGGSDSYIFSAPTPDYFLPNKTYQLFASAPGKKSLHSTCSIPQKYEANIDSVHAQIIPIDSFNYTLELFVSFYDQAIHNNYYRLIPQQIMVNESNPSDTLFFPLTGNPLLLASDKEAVRGLVQQSYSLAQYHFGFSGYKLVGYTLHVLHCSELYYSYHQKIQQSEGIDDNLNPVFVPSNIQNGYGIFTGVNGLSEKKFFFP